MMRVLRPILLSASVAVSPFTVADDLVADEPVPASATPTTADEPKSLRVGADPVAPFRAGLAVTIDDDFVDTPLDEALASLSDVGKIPIVIDRDALEEEAIPLDEPIDLRLQGVSIEAVFDRMFEPLGLTWIVKDGALVVTSIEVAEELSNLDLRTYDVGELLESIRKDRPRSGATTTSRTYPQRRAPSNFPDDSDYLIDTVIRVTGTPESWEDQGGPASVAVNADSLVVRQAQRVQEEIDALLAQLAILEGNVPSATVIRPLESPTERRVREELDEAVSLNFVEVPVAEVTRSLQDRLGVDVLIDELALEEEGVPFDQPITLHVEDVPLRSALNRMLAPHGLQGIVRNDALVVTSALIAEELASLQLAVFDVRDLAGHHDLDDLKHTVIRVIGPPESWEDQGGPGSLTSPLPGVFVLRQTQDAVHDVERLLDELRTNLPVPAEATEAIAPGDLVTLDYTFTEHTPEEIADLVETFVEPDGWDGEHLIRAVGRQLFIRTTRDRHERIQELLSGLKSGSADPSFGLD